MQIADKTVAESLHVLRVQGNNSVAEGLFLLAVAVVLVACSTPQPPQDHPARMPHAEQRDDWSTLYDRLQVTGSFIAYDAGRDRWLYIDSAQADVATTPASTFKVFSSLYALESGIAADTGAHFPWDGVHRRPEVDRDLSLAQAYRHSAYWVHRNIARTAGASTLKHWLDTVGYGNADTTGGYDRCWLQGGLRITPHQQVAFLRRLHADALPFSRRTMQQTKSMMVHADSAGHMLRAKTGWGATEQGDVGWFVGWVEAPGKGPVFFANRIFSSDTLSNTFAGARERIAREALRKWGAWP